MVVLGTVFFDLVGALVRPSFGQAIEVSIIIICAALFVVTAAMAFLLPKMARPDSMVR